MLLLHGIHHLTAITARAAENRAFYAGTLGLRLVKKTVNQDDVSAYHLFYADGLATPGTDITFFDWPAAPEQRGTRSIARTGFRVAQEDDLHWWRHHLSEASVRTTEVFLMDERPTLLFEDHEGQRLALVADGGAGIANPWSGSAVPAARQIRGLGPILLSVPNLEPTDVVLTRVMGMQKVREYGTFENEHDRVHVYRMVGDTPGSELHVAVQPNLPPARQGAGGVHHVAFRTPDATEYQAWAARLNEMNVPNSGPIDRYYFRSLYFREPNGILFEIATDGPGFGADEPMDHLGERLALPPFLEPRRAEIEAGLKPL